jgi:hypothetical protein
MLFGTQQDMEVQQATGKAGIGLELEARAFTQAQQGTLAVKRKCSRPLGAGPDRGRGQHKITLEIEKRLRLPTDSRKVHVLTRPDANAEDYMRLTERCAVLARECAAPSVAVALISWII